MPTLTVKDVIKAELLKTCLEVTRTLHDKEAKKDKKRKFSREEVADIEKLCLEIGWDRAKTEKYMKIASILHNAPELKLGAALPLELFAVVLVENSSGNHNYPVNRPLIVTNKEGFLWHPNDGAVTNWKFMPADKPRYASDEEVEQCIKDLTPIQLQKFHVYDVFEPIVDAAMNRQVEVQDMHGHELEDNGTVTLPDGRKITVG